MTLFWGEGGRGILNDRVDELVFKISSSKLVRLRCETIIHNITNVNSFVAVLR
jgi:hypothetical protein